MALFHTTVLDNQIKALDTIGTSSGSIATFDTDRAENLIEVVCDIQYSQASGTPTPSTPIPITTFSEMNVVHGRPTEKLDGYGINGSGIIYSVTRFVLLYMPVVMGEQYIINTNESTDLVYAYYTDVPVSGSTSYDGTRIIASAPTQTITAPINGYVAFRYDKTLSGEGYSGIKYNIPFGQTIAKGTLNVTTGVLEITHSEYVFAGTETPIAYGSGYRYVVLTDKEGKSYGQDEIPNLICNEYNAITRRQIQNGITGISITGNTILLSSDTPSGIQVVYELATPQVIQLDSKTLQALLNENNIWCDTNGNTSVKYILTVGKAIS